jgi:N utilization substance protein B
MLNRRHLRIKVLQALYAYFQANNDNLGKGEKELFGSIDKIYELYISFLLVFTDVRVMAERRMEEGRNKRLPSPEDLNPNTKFVGNRVMNMIIDNKQLGKESNARKINWNNEQDLMRKIFTSIRTSEVYEEYMSDKTRSIEEDKAFLIAVFKKYIANSEPLHYYFEEQSIHWMDDIDLVCSMVIKTMKSYKEDSDEDAPLLPLYKDADDEKSFIKTLFRKTIAMNDEYEALIQEKTKNWEVERIATMDILLMKMAITEAVEFNSIPIKVTLNEYIDISKFYSTPKSNGFINGILDKIFFDLKENGKIKKIGRGLIE